MEWETDIQTQHESGRRDIHERIFMAASEKVCTTASFSGFGFGVGSMILQLGITWWLLCLSPLNWNDLFLYKRRALNST